MELKVNGKFVTSSKVNFFKNPSCYILEKINENYDEKKNLAFMNHDALKTYEALKSCSLIISFPPSEGVSKITFGSICSRSLCSSPPLHFCTSLAKNQ